MIEMNLNGIDITVYKLEELKENYIHISETFALGNNLFMRLPNGKYVNCLTILQAAGYNISRIDMSYPHQWADGSQEVRERIKNGDHPCWNYNGVNWLFGDALWMNDVSRQLVEEVNAIITKGGGME